MERSHGEEEFKSQVNNTIGVSPSLAFSRSVLVFDYRAELIPHEIQIVFMFVFVLARPCGIRLVITFAQ